MPTVEVIDEESLVSMFELLRAKKKIRDPKKLAKWLEAKARELGEGSSAEEHEEE